MYYEYVHIPCLEPESEHLGITNNSHNEHVHIPCLEHEFEHLGITNSHPCLGVTITMHMHKYAYESTSTRGIVCPPPPKAEWRLRKNRK